MKKDIIQPVRRSAAPIQAARANQTAAAFAKVGRAAAEATARIDAVAAAMESVIEADARAIFTTARTNLPKNRP